MLGWVLFQLWFFEMKAEAKPLPGFADTHNHLFAEYAFGGGWLHGSVSGPIEKALSSCDADFEDHAHLSIPFISDFIGRTLGSSGDTGDHRLKREGYPSFSGWPRWDTIAHQQNWEGSLESAHSRGLNLIVASMVNFEPLCDLIPLKNRKIKDCSDSVAVDLQLQAAHDFEAKHAWFQIVRSPAEARLAIESGKLAVVLSIEVTHLFGDEDLRSALDHVYQKDVRTLQMGHQMDNRFTGVAMHNPIFRVLSWLDGFAHRKHWHEAFMPWRFGFHYRDDKETGIRENVKGLSEEGKMLAGELMKRGMLIDLAHESTQAMRDISVLTHANQNYPVYFSHGHFREALDDGKFSTFEKSSPAWVLDWVRDSGGIFGLRTGPEKTKEVAGSGVLNNCPGSVSSFAQSYYYGTSRKLPLAFGTDLNGFIQQIRPRFGNPEETCGAETDAQARQKDQALQTSKSGKRYDQSGLGEIGQLPDVLEDLKRLGADTTSLESSAENFVRMWERAELLKSKRNE